MLEDGWGPVLPESSAPLPLGMLQCLGWTPGVLCVGSTRGVGSGEGRGLIVTQKGLTLSCWAQSTGYEARAAVEAQTRLGPAVTGWKAMDALQKGKPWQLSPCPRSGAQPCGVVYKVGTMGRAGQGGQL